MALFKRNDNKDQAAEDVAERQSEPKPKRKPKPKRDLRGVVRIEELEQALADQDLDDIDPDAVVSMYMPKRRMERIGAALLRMDKLQKALVVLALAFGVLFALSFMQENMGNFTINLNRLELFRRGVAIADNGDFNNATARLAADAVDNGTNIAAEDLPDNLDDGLRSPRRGLLSVCAPPPRRWRSGSRGCWRGTSGCQKGVRLFRHNLASSLLESGIATNVISEILGPTVPY